MLTINNTTAVMTLANVFNSDSCELVGRVFCWPVRRCFVANPLARAGNARDCVNVNLCNDSLNEYGPTEPRAAARSSAHSKSSASNNDKRFETNDDRRL